MVPKATEIRLDRKTRDQLEGWLRASTTEQRMARRARIVLLAADGWAAHSGDLDQPFRRIASSKARGA